MKKICLLYTLLLAAVGLRAQQTLNIGDPAPAVTVAKWLKGAEVPALEKGRVYVVEFWATWCKPCIAGMPHLSELAREYRKDVTVMGVSILERNTTTMATIEEFVTGMGNKMDYHVATDKDKLMAQNWLQAFGERGIPYAFVVDKTGQIVWGGLPKNLDKVLPQVLAGKWDVAKARQDRMEFKRLSALDNNAITLLNPYMGNPGRPKEALLVIDSLLAKDPGLKYYGNTGHFTFYSLLKTNPGKAVEFAKAWLAANDEPRFKTITDAVMGKEGLPPELYRLAAKSYQEQLDRYPWSMDFPKTYKEMAELYTKAGDKAMAEDMRKKVDSK